MCENGTGSERKRGFSGACPTRPDCSPSLWQKVSWTARRKRSEEDEDGWPKTDGGTLGCSLGGAVEQIQIQLYPKPKKQNQKLKKGVSNYLSPVSDNY